MNKPNNIKPEDCPEPFWHETHRYCPVCSWTEDYGKPVVSEEPYTPTTDDVRERYSANAFLSGIRGPEMHATFDRWFAAEIAKAQAEQREKDALIAESDVFWTSSGELLSLDEVAYNVGRREAAAAIREGEK